MPKALEETDADRQCDTLRKTLPVDVMAKALIDTLALKLIETDSKTLGHPAGDVLAKARVDKLPHTPGDAEAHLKTIGKCGG